MMIGMSWTLQSLVDSWATKVRDTLKVFEPYTWKDLTPSFCKANSHFVKPGAELGF